MKRDGTSGSGAPLTMTLTFPVVFLVAPGYVYVGPLVLAATGGTVR